ESGRWLSEARAVGTKLVTPHPFRPDVKGSLLAQVSAQLASSKQYCAKGNRVESSAAQIVEEPRVTNVKSRCGQCSYLVTLWVSPVVGPVRNTSRNLPICTSSPFASTAQSTGSRLTYVPLRLPTSTIWN